ncbi:hypothetical protein E2C01_041739 [Portunus trituberculatus]|uniref:Uncharacterized protein n=1 Tax=Portunus trituberculatus TaxID=210409 RepID=A0A5B7FSN4_PORTR|nr:hypothetical protein [Portunus trituberculatus]
MNGTNKRLDEEWACSGAVPCLLHLFSCSSALASRKQRKTCRCALPDVTPTDKTSGWGDSQDASQTLPRDRGSTCIVSLWCLLVPKYLHPPPNVLPRLCRGLEGEYGYSGC